MVDLVAKAVLAFGDEEYDEALSLYTQAINTGGTSLELLAARSQTYAALGKYVEALEDANKAIELDPNSTQGYLRKGIALFKLEEYEAARATLLKGTEVEPSNKKLRTWLSKSNAELNLNDPPAQTATIAPAVTTAAATVESASPSTAAGSASEQLSVPLAPSAPPPITAKYRHQWLQTLPAVEVNVFAKGLTQDRASVSFTDHSLHIETKDAEGRIEYTFAVEELFGKVVPESCKFTITPSKLEVKLKKADNLHWDSLEKGGAEAASIRIMPTAEAGQPVYPWSSKKHQVDWDKFEAEVKAAEKDEKLEGEAALNQLFQQIYSGADEDTRRAMNKSFVESNGTVLSTNWKEVGSKTIECQAPSTAEVKKL